MTSRLIACTPGSAPGPTLGIEYGKAFTLPLPIIKCGAFEDGADCLKVPHTMSATVSARLVGNAVCVCVQRASSVAEVARWRSLHARLPAWLPLLS